MKQLLLIGQKKLELEISQPDETKEEFIFKIAGQAFSSIDLDAGLGKVRANLINEDKGGKINSTLIDVWVGHQVESHLDSYIRDIESIVEEDELDLTQEQIVKVAQAMENAYDWSDYHSYLSDLVDEAMQLKGEY